MTELLTLTIIALTTARFTRLITTDKLIEGKRLDVQLWLEKRKEDKTLFEFEDEWQSKLAYMLTCPWCLSFWVAIPVTAGVDAVTSVPLPGLVPFVASAVTGIVASRTQ